MKTQLKVAATTALVTLGFAAATPALAFPSGASEFSQLDATLTSGTLVAQASTDRGFPPTGMEPASPTSGSGIDE